MFEFKKSLLQLLCAMIFVDLIENRRWTDFSRLLYIFNALYDLSDIPIYKQYK